MSHDIFRGENPQDMEARSNALVVDEFISSDGLVDVTGALDKLREIAFLTRLISINAARDFNPELTRAALETNESLIGSLRKLLVERAKLPADKVERIIRSPHKYQF